MALLMPMTLACSSMSGPPELPGLMGASVWMRPVSVPTGESISRSRPLTMPEVTVWEIPNGLPMATTASPTSTVSSLARSAAGRSLPASTATTARSRSGSRPTTLPCSSVPSASFTFSSSTPATTWWAVRMRPDLSKMTPEPMPPLGSSCTTAGLTCLTMSWTELLPAGRPCSTSRCSPLLPGRRGGRAGRGRGGRLGRRGGAVVAHGGERRPGADHHRADGGGDEEALATLAGRRASGRGDRLGAVAVATGVGGDRRGDQAVRVGGGQRVGDRRAGRQVAPRPAGRLAAFGGRGLVQVRQASGAKVGKAV